MNITHRDQIGTLLNELELTNAGVEVGVHHRIFSEIILEQWKGNKLYLVDIWEYNQKGKNGTAIMNSVKSRLSEKFPNRFEMIRGFSIKASARFENKSLDFVYIDACHTYAHVVADINAWYPKIKPGGILCGHDYCPPTHSGTTKFGIIRAVDEFLQDHLEYNLHLTDQIVVRPNRGDVNLKSWWIQV